MTRLNSSSSADSGLLTPSPSLSSAQHPQTHALEQTPLRPLRTTHEAEEAGHTHHQQSYQGRYTSSDNDDKREDSLDELDSYEMQSMNDRPAGGHTVPLLSDDKYDRRSHGSEERPFLTSRQSQLRTQPQKHSQPEDQTRRKYIYAALCLLIALVSFVVQTETAVYIQHELKWNKAYCMLWMTHGSWTLLWPLQLVILRLAKRKEPWSVFWRRHVALLRSTAQMVQRQQLHLTSSAASQSPWSYMMKTTAYVTTFLTFAGASWYIAINLTSPSDLTAIYNCSAFFAYVFSIVLLKDKPRLDKIFSVGLAVTGVLVVAYGDTDSPNSHPKVPGKSGGSTNPNPDPDVPPDNRLAGNLIIGVGSVLYGLYEVLYKKYACPPEGTSPNRGMLFANTFGSFVGTFTLTVLWIPLPILHYTGLEPFELPRGQAAWLLAISTVSNAVFSGSFLVLMSLTSPVLSSVAALLTIFLVAITDWLLTGKPLSAAALGGGTLIIIAFVTLSWATYREMQEEARKRDASEENKIFSDEDSDVADEVITAHGEEHDIENDGGAGDNRRSRRSAIVIRGDIEEEEDGDPFDYTDSSTRAGKTRERIHS